MPADERREQLLDAALDVALERGFHAVSVDAVARACGVTRPVVYGLFADRGALLTALVDRQEARALGQLAGVFPPVPGPGETADPDDLLLRGVEAYLTAVAADPRTWRVILLPPEGVPAELVDRVTAGRAVMLGHLQALTDWGLTARGGPDLDPDLFARAVLALSEAAARLLLDDPAHFAVTSFTLFTRTALAALRPGPPPS
ncbi:MAG: TetR family transcriptional regulator [Frankiales bacterium]|nr:TetR family transcriptional regulator [Frankiales bacterium]